MLRLGLIGTDGGALSPGHAMLVCRMVNHGDYNAKFVAVFGENEKETREIAKACDVSFIAECHTDLLGRVDAVFVMPRNGNSHLEYALPFVEQGLPVFIDKPFTCTVEDAERLVCAAKKSGSVICGGSYVKYAEQVKQLKQKLEVSHYVQSGYITFPLSTDLSYGGIHFYSHHLIEEMLAIFGCDVRSISAVAVGDNIIAIAKYNEFPVVMNYASNYGGLYVGAHFSDGGSAMSQVDIAGLDEVQCKLFFEAIKTGRGEEPEWFLMAVKISNAIELSLQKKCEIFI